MKRADPREITTERLVLRPVSAEDVDALHEMRRDETWAFFGAPEPVTRADVEASVHRAVAAGWAGGPSFVITLAGEVVGEAVLQVDAADENANLGYAVARPHWRRGIATEAARALVGHGFADWELPRIFARADPRNGGSIRVLESIPMTYEGTLRRHHIRRGERVDRALYGLLREEWLA